MKIMYTREGTTELLVRNQTIMDNPPIDDAVCRWRRGYEILLSMKNGIKTGCSSILLSEQEVYYIEPLEKLYANTNIN